MLPKYGTSHISDCLLPCTKLAGLNAYAIFFRFAIENVWCSHPHYMSDACKFDILCLWQVRGESDWVVKVLDCETQGRRFKNRPGPHVLGCCLCCLWARHFTVHVYCFGRYFMSLVVFPTSMHCAHSRTSQAIWKKAGDHPGTVDCT